MQLVKKYDKGDMPKSDWLDAMAFRKMSEIHTVGHHHPQLYEAKAVAYALYIRRDEIKANVAPGELSSMF